MPQELLDIMWMLVAASLVFMMQGGFMCLESGFTRSKNSINVAIKNFTDFLISFALFWVWGFGVMFGASNEGWIGLDHFFLPFETAGQWTTAFFFFQAMFCATSVTILSGAVAERMRYINYVVLAFIISGLIYPVYGHWVWNSASGISTGGWLGNRGFVDFAGSSVVHSVGGWVSLACLLVIGPRRGRFPEGAPPRTIHGHDLPLSVLGAILLFMGWFGFNGGSTLTLNSSVPMIIANTALAGCTGGLMTLGVGWMIRKLPDVGLVINGALAGLVAITANCHVVSAEEAAIIGAIGGLVMLGTDSLLTRLRIDDAVGAIPVHLSAGVWGTLAVAFFGNAELLGTGLGYGEQVLVQLLGVAVGGVWAFGVTYLILLPINRVFPFRVDVASEEQGLNFSEHGATTELIDLLQAMEEQGRAGDLSIRVPVEPFTEVGQIARRYNLVMDRLQKAVNRSDHIVRDIQDGIVTFARNGVLTSLNPGAEKLFGYAAADLMGMPVTTLLAASPAGEAIGLEALLDWGNKRSDKLLYGVRRDSGRFPVEVRVSPGSAMGGSEYTSLVKDVTERKVAEDALQESRDRTRRHNHALTVLSNAERKCGGNFPAMVREIVDVAMKTLDLGRVTVWRFSERPNTLQNVYLFERGEHDLKQVTLSVEIELPAALRNAMQTHRLISTGDAMNDPRTRGLWIGYLLRQNITSLLITQLRMGGEVWGLLFFEQTGVQRHWYPEEEQFAASSADFLVMAYEEAERLRVEEEIRQINEQLEHRVHARTAELQTSNQELRETLERLERTQNKLVNSEKMAALGELVAGVAHEINTPVGVAVTATSHLQLKTEEFLRQYDAGQIKKSELERYLRLAGESTTMLMSNLTRAADLVQSFKKVAVDQTSEAMRVFDLREYVHEVLLSLRPKLKKTEHDILVHCPEDLQLRTFPGALSQILTNLIMNSLIHGFEEKEAGKIEITFSPEESELLMTYRDNGKGIPPEYLGRIFDPFFTTRRGSGGSGLGLHILYNIVSQQLQGSIHCESEPGVGTAFFVRFAMNIEEEAA
ncbi:MAG: ammonium transporter [Candidatus Hydrogenedentes bacterium]|nr:ammonium transporter [Candidatus Hydrogenedentota bacterium]